MENKENSLIYTVSTIDYLEQAIVGLKSVKNNNKFKFYFIFLVDIKKESFEKIKKDIKINYPWIELFATHQLNNKYKKLMHRTYKVFSPLEICSISKSIYMFRGCMVY